MNISVLGCGRWGSFISWYLANHNHNVIEWGREDSPSFKVLKEKGKNEYAGDGGSRRRKQNEDKVVVKGRGGFDMKV